MVSLYFQVGERCCKYLRQEQEPGVHGCETTEDSDALDHPCGRFVLQLRFSNIEYEFKAQERLSENGAHSFFWRVFELAHTQDTVAICLSSGFQPQQRYVEPALVCRLL
jgi:hypothetical protein